MIKVVGAPIPPEQAKQIVDYLEASDGRKQGPNLWRPRWLQRPRAGPPSGTGSPAVPPVPGAITCRAPS